MYDSKKYDDCKFFTFCFFFLVKKFMFENNIIVFFVFPPLSLCSIGFVYSKFMLIKINGVFFHHH
jgi:hypothetical protein